MAKYTPGPMVGAVSGGLGNTVFTRGRYGAVLRQGAIPTRRQTTYTNTVRSRLTTLAKAWVALDAASRASWVTWAGQNPIVDRLGQSQVLQGNAAFIKLNARVAACSGAQLSQPVVASAPAPISGTVALTAVQPSTAALAWTSGALGAGEHLMIYAAVLLSPSREFYANLEKLIIVSAAAAVTPLALGTALNARFGYIKAGAVVRVRAIVCDDASGLISSPALVSCVVTAP